jgi:MFS family permease
MDSTWYRELTAYQWLVLLVATLGWLFDSMDQQLFVIARGPAIRDLAPGASPEQLTHYGAVATSILIVGWATGGMVFGVLGDRWGRARTMILTILLYSLCTGLSGLATSWWNFAILRFLSGLGIGGEYAAGVALVAESMPDRARPYCLASLQGLSALGHVCGSLLSLWIGPQSYYSGVAGWRWLFFLGALPAILVVLIRLRLKESNRWTDGRAQTTDVEGAKDVANPASLSRSWTDSVCQLLSTRSLRKHVAIGMGLAVCGQIGLWGIGYWTPELIRGAQAEMRMAQLDEAKEKSGSASLRVSQSGFGNESIEDQFAAADDRLVARGAALQDAAGMCGIYSFALLTARVGRRWAFASTYLLAFAATVFTFSSLHTAVDVYMMMPLLGFSISSVYGGYAIYFPELFPTRLRSTGVGFCYNAARYLTAGGPFVLSQLSDLFAKSGTELPLRGAAVCLSSVYLIGVAVSYFAPETSGQPLPE